MQKEIEALRPKLKEILYDCAVEIRATKAALYLYDGLSRYDLAASYGFKVPIREWADKNDPVVDRCGRGRNPFIINGLAEEPRFSELMYESQTDRMFVYPIWMRGQLVGLIDMRDKAGKHLFDPADIPKATIIADRIIELFSDKNVFKQRYISLADEEKGPGESSAETRPRTVERQATGAHAAVRPAPEPARPAPPAPPPPPAPAAPPPPPPSSRVTANSFMPSLASIDPPGPAMPSLSSIAPPPPPAPFVSPRPPAPLAPPPEPIPEPPAAAPPAASAHVPRVSAIVLEARTACGELMARKSDDVLTETEMFYVRESLKTTLGIPGAVVAVFSAFGHLGGIQEVASRTQVSAEGVKFLQSRLHIWLSKRGESAGITRTSHMQPIGPPGPPVEVTQMQKVFTAPVTAGSLTGLYLTVAFSDAPDRYAHEFLAENLNNLQTAIEQSFSRSTLQRTRLRAAERLLEPEFTSYPELKRHTQVVVDLADRFAREVDLPPRESEQLHLLAMVHDVGMRMLEYDRLYLKRDIREEELNVLREHVFVSAAMVEPLLGSEIAKAVLCHHERVDGLGYPNELKGEDIPLLARMLQLCDSWAAITDPQGYQTAEPPEMAMAMLTRGSGTQFDSDLTMRFLAMIKGGR